MKKIILAFLVISIMYSCKQAGSHKDAGNQSPGNAYHLTLNKGTRWKTDQSTAQNVKMVQEIAHRFKQTKNPSLTAYNAAGNELQVALIKMINECRMKGEEHKALHIWLEPLLMNVNDMKISVNQSEAAALFVEIDKQLSVYNQYFE